jgi:hypothetical protein
MQPIGRHFITLFATLALLCNAESAWAFKLNPCLRVLVYNDGKLEADKIRTRNLCGLAPEKLRLTVHEHMTNFAIDEYRGSGFLFTAAAAKATGKPKQQVLSYMVGPEWTKFPATISHKTDALILGTWWNDDPLMYLWGSGGDFRHGLDELRALFREIDDDYQGGVSECWIPKAQHLAWNSHFGSLQYLHFMTNGAEKNAEYRLDKTLEKSLSWIKFAYSVATRTTPADAPLTAETEAGLGLPSIAQNYCLRKPSNAKIRTLFARPSGDDALRDRRTPDVALGTILHIIQDSFSPAHTCRVDRMVNGERVAVLKEVFNYNEQDHDVHARHDVFPDWLLSYAKSGEHTYANDPIKVGAWLLQAVDANTPWKDVETHLKQTVFLRDDRTPSSTQGSCISQTVVSYDSPRAMSIASEE